MTDRHIPVALQLYTVRDETARDFAGTLKRVAAMGYAGVEFAGTGGLSATELRRMLDDLGLRCAGGHVGLEQFAQDLEGVIAFYQTLGSRFVGIPYLAQELRPDEAGYRAVARQLNDIGAACRRAGLTLTYHNHDFEFERLGSRYALEILLEAADPALVKWQPDVYWITYAGLDPAAWLRRYPGRSPLIHLKDGTVGGGPAFAEVGEGSVNFEAIFAAAPVAGAEWYIVEQDMCARPTLESAALSLKHLKEWGIA